MISLNKLIISTQIDTLGDHEWKIILEMFGIKNNDILLLGRNIDDYYPFMLTSTKYSIIQLRLNELYMISDKDNDLKEINELIFIGNKQLIPIFWDIYLLHKCTNQLEIWKQMFQPKYYSNDKIIVVQLPKREKGKSMRINGY